MKKLLQIAFTFAVTLSIAQGKLSEGVITSKMTMSSANEQLNAQLQMVGDTQILTYIKGAKMRSETSNPMTGETISITDRDENKVLTLQNIPMYGKTYSISEFVKDDIDTEGIDIKKTENAKEILGYTCDMYDIIMTQDGVDMTVKVFATTQIEAVSKQTATFGGKFEGFPMHMVFDVKQQGMDMVMTYEVTDVSKDTVPEDKFDMTVPEGYIEKQ